MKINNKLHIVILATLGSAFALASGPNQSAVQAGSISQHAQLIALFGLGLLGLISLRPFPGQ